LSTSSEDARPSTDTGAEAAPMREDVSPAEARPTDPRPGIYRHFKGNHYELLGCCADSETCERRVLYRALYGERGLWVRPLSMWSERVDRGDYHGPRFTRLDASSLHIRPAVHDDLLAVMHVYDAARSFMVEQGNPTQWGDGYPSYLLLADDVAAGRLYVGEVSGRICCAFVFFVGIEPDYLTIREGAWLDDEPYGVIHRIASDGALSGVTARCVDFCRTMCANIRIDTHADNLPMQRALARLGFVRCGIVDCRITDSPRIAFQSRG